MFAGLFSIYPAQQPHLAMYSPAQRLCAIGSYIMTCASVALPLIALTSHLLTVQPAATDISFQLNDVNFVRGHEDPFMPALVNIARLDFDLMADFRPTFANWNTKQVVAMLVLRYPSKEYERNEVVFWDRIIKRSSAQKLFLSNAKAKYNVVDVADGLAGAEATIELHWNVITWIGYLTQHRREVGKTRMPDGPPKVVYNYEKYTG